MLTEPTPQTAPTAPQPKPPTKTKKIVLGLLAVLLVALIIRSRFVAPPVNAPAVPVPTIANVQMGTYQTSTRSIVVEKTVFDKKETVSLRGEVRDIPDHSSLFILMQSADQAKNYCVGQIPNTNPIKQDYFHFSCGQERPAGNYTILLELFGSDKQQIGEKVIMPFTVK